MGKKSYIAVFDIDDTIIKVNSSKLIIHAAHKKGLMSTKDLIKAIYHIFLYKYNLKDTLKIIDEMGSWVSGTRVVKFKELVDSVFNSELIDNIRPEIKNEIKFHKNNNAELVILSSAVSEICNPVAEYLGMDHILCSELEILKGRFTGRPVGKFCFGKEKFNRLQQFCYEHDYALINSWYYADSIDDFHVLNQVGHPVCVSPDKKLSKIATKKRWPIYLWD